MFSQSESCARNPSVICKVLCFHFETGKSADATINTKGFPFPLFAKLMDHILSHELYNTQLEEIRKLNYKILTLWTCGLNSQNIWSNIMWRCYHVKSAKVQIHNLTALSPSPSIRVYSVLTRAALLCSAGSLHWTKETTHTVRWQCLTSCAPHVEEASPLPPPSDPSPRLYFLLCSRIHNR